VTSISHVVLVSWKSGKQLHAEELVLPSIRGFLGTIPGVVAVVEGLEDGYHYGFIVTFAMPQARDAYLNDRITARSPRRSSRPPSESSSSTSDPAWVSSPRHENGPLPPTRAMVRTDRWSISQELPNLPTTRSLRPSPGLRMMRRTGASRSEGW
jgi:hypothetical protein